jgi:hypothetical protein
VPVAVAVPDKKSYLEKPSFKNPGNHHPGLAFSLPCYDIILRSTYW